MNLIKFEGFKVDYNSYLDRINITKNRDWIGISQLTLNIWLTLFDVESDFEKVTLKQDDCIIEIIKLSKISLLSLTNRNFSTSIVVTEKEIDKVRSNIDLIREKIKTMTKNPTKKPKILNMKRKLVKNEVILPPTNQIEETLTSPYELDFSSLPLPNGCVNSEFNLSNTLEIEINIQFQPTTLLLTMIWKWPFACNFDINNYELIIMNFVINLQQ